jgi:glycosyltransferase involved in cell wall biosynthesis
MKLASVVMPVFNAQTYLDDSISSILNQSYKNFELLILDDGSTDDSLQIIKRYATMDGRIRFFSGENKGLVYTLNWGIDESKGHWIVRMDADDIADSNRIERQIDYMLKNNLDLSGTWAKKFGADNGFIKPSIFHNDLVTDLLFKSCFVHPSMIIKRNIFEAITYDALYKHAEDYQLWCNLANRGYKFGNVPEVLLMYRTHASQVSNVNSEHQKKISQEIRGDYLVNFLLMNGMQVPLFKNLIANFNSLELLSGFGCNYFIKIYKSLNSAMQFHFMYLVKTEMIKLSVKNPKVIYSYIRLSIASRAFNFSHLFYLLTSMFLSRNLRVKFHDICRARLRSHA